MSICAQTKKTIFSSRRRANSFIESREKIKNETGMLRSYFCDFCNGYHLSKNHEKYVIKKVYLTHYEEFRKYLP